MVHGIIWLALSLPHSERHSELSGENGEVWVMCISSIVVSALALLRRSLEKLKLLRADFKSKLTHFLLEGPPIATTTLLITERTIASTHTTTTLSFPPWFNRGEERIWRSCTPRTERTQHTYENAWSVERGQMYTGNAAGLRMSVPSTEQAKSAGSVDRSTVENSAASYVPSMEQIRNTATSVVGSTAPTTTLPGKEVGQNTSPKTCTAVGLLPGPTGEKDVVVLPDENTSHTSSSHPIGTSTTFKATLLSDEVGHSPSVHATAGPLPSGVGTSLVKLPEETRFAGSRAGLPGYMGGLDHSARDIPTTSAASLSIRADSQAGSIAERNGEREREKEKEKKGVVGETKDTLKKAEVKDVEKVLGVGSKGKNTASSSTSSSTSGAGNSSYPAKTGGLSGVTTASRGPDATRREFTSSSISEQPSKVIKHAGATEPSASTSETTHAKANPAARRATVDSGEKENMGLWIN
ncbi:hypothetical protein BDQ17DRAFT_1410958 [Cyathus striatus]|nr:hypothetical protein BDQ17DRAFT_1410958 [Cyathus striatus]